MGRQILISFEQKIDAKNLDVSFTCEEDRMFVLADQDAVHQILYNICDNAVKFSRPGGHLALDFSWKAGDGRHGRKAVVRVCNEGQGIPPEDLPYIFERFYKSDKSRSLDKTGVGLGMYIAKTIIEAHGETISVRSEYGKDCEFTFTMPETNPPESQHDRCRIGRACERVVPGAASGCANTGIGAGGDESVFRGKPNAGSQHGTRYPIPLDIRGTAGI